MISQHKELAADLSSTARSSISTLQSEPEDGPLWSSIKRQLYKSEVAHIKRLVGEALILKNRIMWDEVASLKQILTEFQQQNEELSENLKKQVRFCGSQHRDLLRQQAQIMVTDIKRQAESYGHALEDLLPDWKDKQLQDYVYGNAECRRGDSGKFDGFTPPATPSTRPPSSCGRSGCSTPDSNAGRLPTFPLGRALSLKDMDVVAASIREALESEQESLFVAIGEQQSLLEAEATLRAEAHGRFARGEPSTAKLQEFVNKLQEVAASPTLRTLSLTDVSELASPVPPMPRGSHVRRLQALISQRRLATPREPPCPVGLGAVPEIQSPSSFEPTERSGVSANSAARNAPVDPFFDDPVFAAAVGAGYCSSQASGYSRDTPAPLA